jgi:hypothetical protein
VMKSLAYWRLYVTGLGWCHRVVPM